MHSSLSNMNARIARVEGGSVNPSILMAEMAEFSCG